MPFFAVAGLIAVTVFTPQQAAPNPQAAQQAPEQAQSQTAVPAPALDAAQPTTTQQEDTLQQPSQQQAPPPEQQSAAQAPAAPQNVVITIPAGTTIQLALTSPVTNRTARKGGVVRGATTFPVTAGGQMAIPVGTYVEGTIENVGHRDGFGRPALQLHFTRMVFNNGYTVPLNAETDAIAANVEKPGNATAALAADAGAPMDEPDAREAPEPAAEAFRPVSDSFGEGKPRLVNASFRTASVANASFANGSFANSAFPQQQPQPPQLPPLPHTGPPTGFIVGAVVAAAATVVIAVVALSRGARTAVVYYDSGWQFEMTLENPLSLDANAVAAAASAP